jgi:hypothetical protein
MQKVLDALEKEPVGIHALRKASPRWCKCILYDKIPADATLKGILGKRFTCLIVLFQMHALDRSGKRRPNNSVGHFVCLSRKASGQEEYFSSYGHVPGYAIAKTYSDPHKFDKLFSGKPLVNKTRFQTKDHSNTCARWCLARVMLAPLSLKSFQTLFMSRTQLRSADDLCALATLFLIH